MPHSLLKDFKSNIGGHTAVALEQLKQFAKQYANGELDRIIDDIVTNNCPDTPELEVRIKKVDRVEVLTNKTLVKVDKYNEAAEKLKLATKAGKVAADILAHLGVPTSLGGPGMIGLVFSFPQGLIQAQANLLVWIRKTVNTLEDDAKVVRDAVRDAKSAFEPVKQKIATVRGLLDGCALNPDLTLEERQALANSIKGTSVKESAEDIQYTSISGTTYNLKIITDTSSPSIALRRRAIAVDARGITMLKGPLSFSSSTEVLINELKFRINNQLP